MGTARAGAAPKNEAEGRRRDARSGGRAERPCPRCCAQTRLVPNPYYGVGLSVNKEIRLCTRCDWACSATGAAVAVATAAAQVLAPSARTQTGRFCRARAAWGRFFAGFGLRASVS